MNCPQCGTELSNSATFCPRCGTSLRPASFSYLPAGTPPWPSAAPQSYSYVPTSAIETSQKTAAPAVTSVPASKPRRSAGSVLLIIGLLALSVVIGVGGTFGLLALNGPECSDRSWRHLWFTRAQWPVCSGAQSNGRVNTDASANAWPRNADASAYY